MAVSVGCWRRQAVFRNRLRVLQPSLAGEQRHRDHYAKYGLRQRGVGRRNRPWQVKQHRQPAQNALSDHRRQRDPSQCFHPPALFHALRPHRHHDDQQADELGEHAMAVLIFHPAYHRRNLVQRTERSRPVRHRQTSIVAGDQGAEHDQHQRRARRETPQSDGRPGCKESSVRSEPSSCSTLRPRDPARSLLRFEPN